MKLRQLVYTNSKLLNQKFRKVNAQPVGGPIIIETTELLEEITQELMPQDVPSDVTSYVLGSPSVTKTSKGRFLHFYPVQFYKDC